MRDWNVVVTIREDGLQAARRVLRNYGPVELTAYLNVVVMRVDDRDAMLKGLEAAVEEDPEILGSAISSVTVGQQCFSFQRQEEFEARARDAVLALIPALRGKVFHVRVHRRGFKGRLSSRDEERYLGHELLEALAADGSPGSISFEDPDAVVAVETVSNRACVSCWTRDELRAYPFLRPR